MNETSDGLPLIFKITELLFMQYCLKILLLTYIVHIALTNISLHNFKHICKSWFMISNALNNIIVKWQNPAMEKILQHTALLNFNWVTISTFPSARVSANNE